MMAIKQKATWGRLVLNPKEDCFAFTVKAGHAYCTALNHSNDGKLECCHRKCSFYKTDINERAHNRIIQ